MVYLDLFTRFAVISLLAFGGGQAALPLVERVAVQEAGWISPALFGAAVAFGYVTPGPVLITATFIGYQVAGDAGALVATLGAFLAPWGLAALVAGRVKRFAEHPWLRAFGAGAAPAVVGLLGVTVLSVGRDALVGSWLHAGIFGAALILAAFTRIHPVMLLALGGALGWAGG